MAKITEKARSLCASEQNRYRQLLARIASQVVEIEKSMAKSNEAENAMKHFEIARLEIFSATIQLQIANLTMRIMGIRNDDLLSDVRKSISHALSELEAICGNYADVPFSEAAEKIEVLRSSADFASRFFLIRKLGLLISLVMLHYDKNSRGYWTYAEVRGRFAAVARNLFNWQEVAKSFLNLAASDHETALKYVGMVRKIYPATFEGYNERFDFGTRSLDDLRLAENFANAYLQCLQAIGDAGEFEKTKERAKFFHDKYAANREKEDERKEKQNAQ